MKTAKDLELLLLVKEHEKQKLQLRINQAIRYIKEMINFRNNLKYIENIIKILEGEDDEIRN